MGIFSFSSRDVLPLRPFGHPAHPPIYVSSSTGRVPVSKTGGCSFESSLTCQTVALLCTVFGAAIVFLMIVEAVGWILDSSIPWLPRFPALLAELVYAVDSKSTPIWDAGSIPVRGTSSPLFDQGRFSFFSPSAIRLTISTRTGRMRPERIFRPSPS